MYIHLCFSCNRRSLYPGQLSVYWRNLLHALWRFSPVSEPNGGTLGSAAAGILSPTTTPSYSSFRTTPSALSCTAFISEHACTTSLNYISTHSKLWTMSDYLPDYSYSTATCFDLSAMCSTLKPNRDCWAESPTDSASSGSAMDVALFLACPDT